MEGSHPVLGGQGLPSCIVGLSIVFRSMHHPFQIPIRLQKKKSHESALDSDPKQPSWLLMVFTLRF